jgi:hypothetical protein
MLSGRFREKLLEVLQKVWGGVKQAGNLSVNVLDRL